MISAYLQVGLSGIKVKYRNQVKHKPAVSLRATTSDSFNGSI